MAGLSKMSKELRDKIQPDRMKFALAEFEKRGIKLEYQDEKEIWFYWKGSRVTLFPFTGWHTGRTIKDGRGLINLLTQLK